MMKRMYFLFNSTHVKTLYFYLLSVFMLFSAGVKGQESNKNTDVTVSTEMKLFIEESDSIYKIEELILDTFDFENDTILGLKYCKLYLDRGKKEENDAIELFSNFQIAYISFYQSDYEEALKRSYVSTKLAEKVKDTANLISSNVLLGGTWYVLGSYDEALKPYLTAKELATTTKNVSYEIICLTNIANIRAKLNRYENALDSYNDILNIVAQKKGTLSVQDVVTRLSALLGKVLCLAELKRFEEAEDTYTIGVALAEKNNYQAFKGRFYINLGKVYHEKGEYHKSLGFLKEGKEMLKATSLQNNLFITDFYIAENLSKQKKYEEALAILDAIFERVGDHSNTDKIEEMYELAIQISRVQQNQDKEIEYYRASQKIIETKNDKKTAARNLLFEDDMKAYELENEKLANKNTQSLVDKKIILIVSAILVILLLLIFFSYYTKAKLKEQKFLAIIENISKHKTVQTSQKTTQNSAIKDEKAKAILEKLETLEETEFYLSQDVTLHTTAKLLQTNTTYLSKALNDVKKESFSQYLNKLRIDYVLVKLKEDSVFRSYTIHAISKEIGYKSATTFIKEFKNKTGLNPSYYIKKIEN